LTCVRHGPPVTVHSAKPSFENPSRVSRHPGNDIRPGRNSTPGISELRELRQLREENGRLKRLVADLSLDRQILQEIVSKKL